MIIKWQINTGIVGSTQEGELEIDNDATDEEIEAAAKEEAFSAIHWEWTKKED